MWAEAWVGGWGDDGVHKSAGDGYNYCACAGLYASLLRLFSTLQAAGEGKVYMHDDSNCFGPSRHRTPAHARHMASASRP
jgi:hypothetical protein